MLTALFVMTLDYVLLALAHTVTLILIGRIVGGILAATHATAAAYMADISTPEEKGRNFGLIGAAFGVGFVLAALTGLWCAVQRGWKGGGAFEEVALSPRLMSVTRHDPGRPARHWQGNPYWVRLTLRRDGPVEDYLTLSDGRREIELGAFLSPDERRSLRADLAAALADLARPA